MEKTKENIKIQSEGIQAMIGKERITKEKGFKKEYEYKTKQKMKYERERKRKITKVVEKNKERKMVQKICEFEKIKRSGTEIKTKRLKYQRWNQSINADRHEFIYVINE